MKKKAIIQKLLYVFDHDFCVHLTSKPLETAEYLGRFFGFHQLNLVEIEGNTKYVSSQTKDPSSPASCLR